MLCMDGLSLRWCPCEPVPVECPCCTGNFPATVTATNDAGIGTPLFAGVTCDRVMPDATLIRGDVFGGLFPDRCGYTQNGLVCINPVTCNNFLPGGLPAGPACGGPDGNPFNIWDGAGAGFPGGVAPETVVCSECAGNPNNDISGLDYGICWDCVTNPGFITVRAHLGSYFYDPDTAGGNWSGVRAEGEVLIPYGGDPTAVDCATMIFPIVVPVSGIFPGLNETRFFGCKYPKNFNLTFN